MNHHAKCAQLRERIEAALELADIILAIGHDDNARALKLKLVEMLEELDEFEQTL